MEADPRRLSLNDLSAAKSKQILARMLVSNLTQSRHWSDRSRHSKADIDDDAGTVRVVT